MTDVSWDWQAFVLGILIGAILVALLALHLFAQILPLVLEARY
jgi:hypothetical protein